MGIYNIKQGHDVLLYFQVVDFACAELYAL